ncbi:MAG TPA: ATP-binding protein [Thermoanaerobaculia bacterium]|nr:ATP-binding protein [Thermoanaerobaculia bacterium]
MNGTNGQLRTVGAESRRLPARAAAPTDSALLEAVLDLLPEPVWILDGENRVVLQNAAHVRWQVVAAGLGDLLDDARRRAAAGRPVVVEATVAIEGVEHRFAVHGSRIENAGVLFIARDIGKHVPWKSEAAITHALLRLFTPDEPLRQILPKALEFLCTAGEWDAAILWRREAADVLRPEAWWLGGDASGLEQQIASFAFDAGHGVPGRALAARDMIWIADILDESTMQRGDLSIQAGLRSAVAVPMVESDIVAILEFFTRRVRPLTERKRLEVVRTAEALGHLMARQRAHEERRRLLDLVERKSVEWMSTFDSIELPIFLMTMEGKIARLNRAASGFAGSSFDDLVGRSIGSLGRGEPWTTLTDITAAVRDSGMPCTAQITGSGKTWDVSATLLAVSPAEERRVIIVLHDSTQLIALQEAVRRGEQLAALGELVAGVAHEVKNPMFGMSATLELLERSLSDAETLDLVGTMRIWLARLASLTENLLEYGKTWNIELRSGTIDPYVERAIETCAPRTAEAEIVIERQGGSDGAPLLMDGERIVHVFENLLMNAIHFSPAGQRVTLAIRTDDRFVEFAIRDRGPGFHPDDLPRIFQPFFTRRRGGTGLGLAIVQRIVDEHGGTITARNHTDGGAVVEVRFPKYTG